jgi:pseudaminic acid synthase
MTESFEIAGRAIGPGHPPYLIAELSGNHNGDIARAIRLIDVAKQAGVDAVKLQTYTADTITIDHDGPGFIVQGGLWDGRKLYELYREAHTPWEWHPVLFAYAKKVGITCFSSPFDSTAVDLLVRLDAPAYKIASFEIIDTPLIRYAAKTGKPMIISTGMASPDEIIDAVEAARDAGAGGIALLHCVSGYPTPLEQANLRRIPTLAAEHKCPIGLSDHTPGIEAAVTSIALGAAIIEKHVTLARADGGPDAAFSLEPDELAALVKGTRAAFAALGRGNHQRAQSEEGNMMFRRSLYAVRDISAGEIISTDNVRSIRPGYGLAPKYLPEILGRRASRPIARGTPMSLDLVAPN